MLATLRAQANEITGLVDAQRKKLNEHDTVLGHATECPRENSNTSRTELAQNILDWFGTMGTFGIEEFPPLQAVAIYQSMRIEFIVHVVQPRQKLIETLINDGDVYELVENRETAKIELAYLDSQGSMISTVCEQSEQLSDAEKGAKLYSALKELVAQSMFFGSTVYNMEKLRSIVLEGNRAFLTVRARFKRS